MMGLSMHIEPVRIDAGQIHMDGMLWLPPEQSGVVVFAGGTGSNRVKPPNDYVASVLRSARLGTLWLDLQWHDDWNGGRPDVSALAEQLGAACDWLRQHDATRESPIGLFGASHAAAAALQLAAARGRGISAVVLRGGRPDLALNGTLGKVSAPTLLIVGGLDDGLIGTNRAAYAALRCKKRFEIIPGATHSFEEPGSLEVVARLARGWFLQHADAAYI
jgi:putative phosphoribosyl transferase